MHNFENRDTIPLHIKKPGGSGNDQSKKEPASGAACVCACCGGRRAENCAGGGHAALFQTETVGDEKAAVHSVSVDLSAVAFSKPGVYRYIIQETTETVPGLTVDSQIYRTLDVYVTDEDGELSVSDTVLYQENSEEKSTGYSGLYEVQSLEFGKEVTGNQGSPFKYFKFTVQAAGGREDNVYIVDLTGADTAPEQTEATVYDAETMAQANSATELTAAELAEGHDFYLRDGQYIRIKGLEKGVTYTVSEDEEDYTAAEGIAAELSRDETAYDDAVSGTIEQADIHTGYTNKLNGDLPTGIALTALPGMALIAAAAAVIWVLRARRKEGSE